MLVKHVKNEEGQQVATLVGMKVDDKVVIGWSKRHSDCEPAPFTKKTGRNIAKLRALDESEFIQRQAKPISVSRKEAFKEMETVMCQVNMRGGCCVIPHVLQFGQLDHFIARCKKFYKVDEISNVTE